MNWRLASRLSVVTLAVLVVLIVAVVGTRAGRSASTDGNSGNGTQTTDPSGLQGTYLGSVAAPGFHLTDQAGQPISLAQFKGKPVVLTFFYTHCPDACPLTAEKLHQTMVDLGSNAQKVGVIAVSVENSRAIQGGNALYAFIRLASSSSHSDWATDGSSCDQRHYALFFNLC